MALTPRQRTVLKDWAALRIANWVYTQTWRVGVKETVQVVHPFTGETLDKQRPVVVQDSRMVDTYDADGNVDGQVEEFFMRRDYTEDSAQMIDREEVITRLHRKALKRGMTDTVDEVEVPIRRRTIGNFFRNNRAYFHGLIPGVSWGGANRAGRIAARTEDPDA